MPISIAGDGTISGVSVGGLPDGIVDTDMLATSAVTVPKIGYNGAILQVVQSTPNADVESTTSTAYGDIPDLTATITPSSTSSKILILTDLSLSGTHAMYIRLFRGTTEIGSGNAASGKETVLYQVYSGAGTNGPFYYGFASPSKVVLDSPATTSATTYKYQWRTNAGTLYLNRTYEDSGNYIGRTASSITLLEVSA